VKAFRFVSANWKAFPFSLPFSSTGRISSAHEYSDHSLANALPAAAARSFFDAWRKAYKVHP